MEKSNKQEQRIAEILGADSLGCYLEITDAVPGPSQEKYRYTLHYDRG